MKHSTKKTILTLTMLIMAFSLFAADSSTPSGLSALKTIFGTIYWFFSSTYMLVICSVGLVWVGIKWITNRGEPTVVKDLGPKAGALILIGGASAVCNLFFKPSGNFEVNALTDGSSIFSDLK